MKSILVILSALVALASSGCGDDSSTTAGEEDAKAGKHHFTLSQLSVTREYFVHVPAGYTGRVAVPVVIMLHGTGQTGEQFYNISGWKEVGESEGFLTAFPSALVNCVFDAGASESTSKWNAYPGSGGWRFCDGVTPPDDEGFLRAVVADLRARYNVDPARIYIAGFSNGSEMAARCSVHLSDLFAAAVMSGGGGALPGSGAGTPGRLMPVLSEFGNMDAKLLANLGTPGPLPMNFTTLFTQYPGLYGSSVQPFINTFQLDAEHYATSGDSTAYIMADFHGLSGDPRNVFKLVEVKGLEHEYPNTVNHPLNGAALHWQWFREFTRPS